MVLNRAAGSMKKLWVAYMAKQPEEEVINQLSLKDFPELRDDVIKEGGVFLDLQRWINILEESAEDWKLEPFDMLNVARSDVLFPIGSYCPEDLPEAFSVVDAKVEATPTRT